MTRSVHPRIVCTACKIAKSDTEIGEEAEEETEKELCSIFNYFEESSCLDEAGKVLMQEYFLNIQQLLNKAEQDVQNDPDRGGCYLRNCIILHIVRKLNSVIVLFRSFKILLSFKLIPSRKLSFHRWSIIDTISVYILWFNFLLGFNFFSFVLRYGNV